MVQCSSLNNDSKRVKSSMISCSSIVTYSSLLIILAKKSHWITSPLICRALLRSVVDEERRHSLIRLFFVHLEHLFSWSGWFYILSHCVWSCSWYIRQENQSDGRKLSLRANKRLHSASYWYKFLDIWTAYGRLALALFGNLHVISARSKLLSKFKLVEAAVLGSIRSSVILSTD